MQSMICQYICVYKLSKLFYQMNNFIIDKNNNLGLNNHMQSMIYKATKQLEYCLLFSPVLF